MSPGSRTISHPTLPASSCVSWSLKGKWHGQVNLRPKFSSLDKQRCFLAIRFPSNLSLLLSGITIPLHKTLTDSKPHKTQLPERKNDSTCPPSPCINFFLTPYPRATVLHFIWSQCLSSRCQKQDFFPSMRDHVATEAASTSSFLPPLHSIWEPVLAIAPEESSFPRYSHSKLIKLCSGWSSSLISSLEQPLPFLSLQPTPRNTVPLAQVLRPNYECWTCEIDRCCLAPYGLYLFLNFMSYTL